MAVYSDPPLCLCISLVTNDAENLFIHLLAIWIFPFVKSLFKTFTLLLKDWCLSLLFLIDLKEYFIYSVYKSFLSICVHNISSQQMVCLHMLNRVNARFFILLKQHCRIFVIQLMIQKSLRNLCYSKILNIFILLCFLLEQSSAKNSLWAKSNPPPVFI